jgi:hypothetical protein
VRRLFCIFRFSPFIRFLRCFSLRGPFAESVTDFKGYNCGQNLCPKGDSPFNIGGMNELQGFNCLGSTGTFVLSFRQNSTLPISTNTTLDDLKRKLEQVLTIGRVNVYKDTVYDGDKICSPYNNFSKKQSSRWTCENVSTISSSLAVYIEFLTEYGQLPMLTYQEITPTVTLSIFSIQKSTKVDVECSGMGICNENNGICQCMTGYSSSDGSLYFPGER